MAGARDPERTNLVFTALLWLTALTHLGGFVLAAAIRRALEPILLVQGMCLFATTAALVAMSTYLTLLLSLSWSSAASFLLRVGRRVQQLRSCN